jgi:hypothetical protein
MKRGNPDVANERGSEVAMGPDVAISMAMPSSHNAFAEVLIGIL